MKHKQQGLSLIELMITMLLGLLIVGMMAATYISGATTQRGLNQSAILLENGRYALQKISTEIELAGYFGLRDIASDAVAPIDLCNPTVSNLTAVMRQPIFGYNDISDPNLLKCLPAGETIKQGTDIIVLRRANTSATNLSDLKDDTFYIQAMPSQHQLNVGKSENFSLLQRDGSTLVDILRFEQTIFYINAIDQLRMLSLVGDGYIASTIADGVDTLQVEYGIDHSGDGAPNNSDPSAQADDNFIANPSSSEWANVVSARLFLVLSIASQNAGQLDKKVYTISTTGDTYGPINDAAKRELFSLTTRANNLSMRRQ